MKMEKGSGDGGKVKRRQWHGCGCDERARRLLECVVRVMEREGS